MLRTELASMRSDEASSTAASDNEASELPAATPRVMLIVVRHGYSEYNADNRFTGWADVELSKCACHASTAPCACAHPMHVPRVSLTMRVMITHATG